MDPATLAGALMQDADQHKRKLHAVSVGDIAEATAAESVALLLPEFSRVILFPPFCLEK